jgi:hypothetical protein
MKPWPTFWSKWPLLVSGIFLVMAGRVGAQQAPRTAGTITGVVFDSLDDKPLGEASVFLVGTPLSVTTNPHGGFRFDSVPAGAYRVAFESPELDAIGLTPNTQSVAVRAGMVDTVALFVPSVTALLDAMCPASRAAGGQSILVGSVRDATSGTPVSPATVTLSWTDISVEKNAVIQTHHIVPAVSAADGSYAVCGIPGDAVVMLRAVAGHRASGAIALDVPAQRLVRQDLTVALGADLSAASSAARTAVLAGVVTDAAGHPLGGAEVQLAGDTLIARADEQGNFRLAPLPGGSWEVHAQRIGFLPARAPTDLHPGRVTHTRLVLRVATNTLDTVRVTARAPDLLALREKAREFPSATFFSRAAIDSMHPYRVTDILGRANGVQLVYPDSGGPPLVQMGRSRFTDLAHAGICPVEY